MSFLKKNLCSFSYLYILIDIICSFGNEPNIINPSYSSCAVQEKPNTELEDSIKHLAREGEKNDDILLKTVPTRKQEKLVNKTRSI